MSPPRRLDSPHPRTKPPMAAEPNDAQNPGRTDRCVATPCLSRTFSASRGDLGRLYHRRRAAAATRLSRPAPNHSSAAVFTPLPSPHLISDIVTTVAVRLTAKTRQPVFHRQKCDVAVNVRLYRSGGLLPAVVCHPPSPPVDRGHSEAAPPPRSARRSAAPALRRRCCCCRCWQTMEALSAQARITIPTAQGARSPHCPNSRIK